MWYSLQELLLGHVEVIFTGSFDYTLSHLWATLSNLHPQEALLVTECLLKSLNHYFKWLLYYVNLFFVGFQDLKV